ncbi:intracellular septation protein [Bradyrhizobium macuxiense]|uniref:Inner membrane-spanning protein YciB n=1 Tax=Bradyrhizobium macuxiense TaxID=1755647 RepID=A0A560L283_9BRAD|nr:intracellular septation protein [Bradyrhizobium macuxiense]
MLNFVTELGPLIVFYVINAKFRLFAATAAFTAVTVLAGIASLVVKGHMSIISLITSISVLVFGTLTLVLHDEKFIKVDATIVSGLLSTLLGGGLLFDRSFIVVILDRIVNLTPQGWRILTFSWAMFFAGMTILNEVIWRTQTTDVWVTFRTFGVTMLSLPFGFVLIPLTKRYHAAPVSRSAQSSYVQVHQQLPDSKFRIDVEGVPVEQESIERRGEH